MTVYHINRFYAGMTQNDTVDDIGAATKVVGDVARDAAVVFSSPYPQAYTNTIDPSGSFDGAFGMFAFPTGSNVYGLMMERKDNSTSAINHAIWHLDAFGDLQSQSVLNEYETAPNTFSSGGFSVLAESPFAFFQLKDTVSYNKRVYYVNTFGTSNYYLAYTRLLHQLLN